MHKKDKQLKSICNSYRKTYEEWEESVDAVWFNFWTLPPIQYIHGEGWPKQRHRVWTESGETALKIPEVKRPPCIYIDRYIILFCYSYAYYDSLGMKLIFVHLRNMDILLHVLFFFSSIPLVRTLANNGI